MRTINSRFMVTGYIFIPLSEEEVEGTLPLEYRAHRMGSGGLIAKLNPDDINGWDAIRASEYPAEA
jgi:hypothetical protein